MIIGFIILTMACIVHGVTMKRLHVGKIHAGTGLVLLLLIVNPLYLISIALISGALTVAL